MRRAKGRACAAVALVLTLSVVRFAGKADATAAPVQRTPPSSAEWLGLLPDGPEKRRFILDCTGCHQFDERTARTEGRPRTRDEWHVSIAKMLGFAGASTGFPVISAYRDSAATADWLSSHLTPERTPGPRRLVPGTPIRAGAVTEFALPHARDLPHDVAIDDSGRVVITGMMTHRIYVLEPATGAMSEVEIPVQRANPRAVEVDSAGNWWVVLGAPYQLARYEPAQKQWRTFDVDMYAHSVAVGRGGRAWVNGHFTREPEVVASVDAQSGAVRKYELPLHPTMGKSRGGPIPYEIRVAPDGRLWMSELQGNRLVSLDPRTGATTVHEMPTPFSGPRRFDVDSRGVLWIPAYASNELVRFDPASSTFERFTLPIADAVPYVVRIDQATGMIWIGTSAADAVLSFESRTSRFTVYPLPSQGALVRHLAIDPRTHDVWVAYGAAPGITARIARLRPG
jgi:virginiamycin B lyase